MWVNIDMQLLDIEMIVDCLASIFQTFNQEIILTFNTINSQYIIEDLINVIINECAKRKIPVIVGPQFVEEGILEEGKITLVDELYFATKGEKMIWYLQNRHLPIGIEYIVLVNEVLDIDPIILKRKSKNANCQFYFLYTKSVVPNIEDLVKDPNYHFKRIRKGKDESVYNN